jgi:ribulose-5-phosphate 4-epimerase/fuculose-1-phosphate aldolase
MFEEIEPGDLVVGKDSANGTGDVIHGSIYGVRNDVMAVCHTHTDAITAVSCLKGGLQFL